MDNLREHLKRMHPERIANEVVAVSGERSVSSEGGSSADFETGNRVVEEAEQDNPGKAALEAKIRELEVEKTELGWRVEAEKAELERKIEAVKVVLGMM